MKRIWLVKHPTNQYSEDVLALALANDLQVVDAIFANDIPSEKLAINPPTLTLRSLAGYTHIAKIKIGLEMQQVVLEEAAPVEAIAFEKITKKKTVRKKAADK